MSPERPLRSLNKAANRYRHDPVFTYGQRGQGDDARVANNAKTTTSGLARGREVHCQVRINRSTAPRLPLRRTVGHGVLGVGSTFLTQGLSTSTNTCRLSFRHCIQDHCAHSGRLIHPTALQFYSPGLSCTVQLYSIIWADDDMAHCTFSCGCRSSPSGCEHGPSRHRRQHRLPCNRCPRMRCRVDVLARSGLRPWHTEQQPSDLCIKRK